MTTRQPTHRRLLVLAIAAGLAAPLACHWDREDAHARLYPVDRSGVTGDLRFTTVSGGKVRIEGRVHGLSPGKHGFHIHEFGECEGAGAKAAGDHFNPEGAPHGAPWSAERHAGDLGNIEANDDGVAEVRIESDAISLGDGEGDVKGRALIIHADADDFTQPAGNAGARVACGVITAAQGATPIVKPDGDAED